MRRKTAVAGFSYLAGVFFASFLNSRLNFTLSAVLFFVSAVVVLFVFKNKAFVMTTIISFAVGLGIYGAYEKFDYEKTICYDGKTAVFKGEILDYDYIANDIMLVTVKGEIENKNVKLTAFVPYDDCEYYDKIEFSATYEAIADNPCFNSLEYNKPDGIYLTAKSATDIRISDGGFSILKYIRNYSDYLYDQIIRIIPAQTGAFLGAMLCGDTSKMEASTKSALNRMGIGHIFAVSGTHLLIVSYVVGFFLDMLKISKKKKIILTEAVILAFVVFSGMSSSVLRASVMVTILNLSKLFKRSPDSMTTIAICGVVLTLFSPEKIRSASFLLSMSGAFSLSVVSPAVVKAIDYKGKLKTIINSFISMCAIWVCSLPFSLMFFNSVSTVAPITNIIFVPLCVASLVFLVVFAFVSFISIFVEPLLFVSGLFIVPVLKASELINNFRFSYIPLGIYEVRLCMIMAVIVILIMTASGFKPKTIVKSVVLSLIILCGVASFVTLLKRDVLEVYVINYENSCITVLNKNRKAVIIDKDGDISEACFRLIEYKGVVEVQQVFTYGNHEFLDPYYASRLYFTEFETDNTLSADDVVTYDFDGVRIDFKDEVFSVNYNDTVSEFSYFKSPDMTGDSNLKIKCYGDFTEVSDSTQQKKTYEYQNGLIIKYKIDKQGISEIRRFDYAFG